MKIKKINFLKTKTLNITLNFIKMPRNERRSTAVLRAPAQLSYNSLSFLCHIDFCPFEAVPVNFDPTILKQELLRVGENIFFFFF